MMNAMVQPTPPRKRGISLPLLDIDIPEHLDRPFAAAPTLEYRDGPRDLRPANNDRRKTPPRWSATQISIDKQPIGSALELYSALTSEAGSFGKLGEALVACGWVTQADLDRALEVQRELPGKLLGEILLNMGLLTRERLNRALAERLGIPVVDVRRFPVDAEARQRIPASVCARHGLMPVQMHEGSLVVAMANPFDREAIDAARFASGCRVIPVLSEGAGGREVLDRHVALRNVQELTLVSTPEMISVEEIVEVDTVSATDSALVQLVNRIILEAFAAGASDVHIEPGAGKRPTRVRLRRDGVLADYAEIPPRLRSAVVSRLKIMAGLDIAERRRPQDGRIDFARFGGTPLELRIATIPTSHGVENVVLRLLHTARAIDVDQLGIEPRALERMKALVNRPHGLLLVCGPTGSGKTTTLHSLISHINTPERKIWTAEDPIEITQDGLCQVQVNARIGFTFAAALRSMLRADPDVIMVGEMRDTETANTAVDASLTGHLVLSTLHTNGAAETVGRILEMEVDPHGFADSLLGVVAQRLVRRVCPDCKVVKPADEETLFSLAREYAEEGGADAETVMAAWRARPNPPVFAHGEGCSRCGNTGLRGRLGLFELLEVTPAMRALIQERSTEALKAEMSASGLRTLLQDGIEKVLAGETTLEQVRAAAG